MMTKEEELKNYQLGAMLIYAQNPDFAKDPIKIRQRLKDLEADLEKCKDSPSALRILIIGRNSLAYMLGEELMPLPDFNAAQKKLLFEENLSAMAEEMQKPARQLKMLIIDDSVEDIKGICAFLVAWPSVEYTVWRNPGQNAEELAVGIINNKYDVVFLDEDLKYLRRNYGYAIAYHLLRLGFRGKIVSISSTLESYADYSFRQKRTMLTEEESAEDFLKLMNKIIKSI
jgi:hypothetical protein